MLLKIRSGISSRSRLTASSSLVWVWDIPSKQKSLLLSQTKMSDFYGNGTPFLCLLQNFSHSFLPFDLEIYDLRVQYREMKMLKSLIEKYGDDFSWFEFPLVSTQKRAFEERLQIETTPDPPYIVCQKCLLLLLKAKEMMMFCILTAKAII